MIEDLSPSEHLHERQTKIKPLVDEFFKWVKDNRKLVDTSSNTGEAFTYAMNQKKYLRVFREDPKVPLDNNLTEIAIRPFTVDKKN